MHKPIYVSICNQKGGVGKSCFTILAASYLCYQKGFNVAIMDCDYPQHSDVKFREWEAKKVKEDAYYNREATLLFDHLQRPVYPIYPVTPDNALELADKIVAQSKTRYDILFFDLPGTVNNKGVLRILGSLDYYIVPVEASLPVLESSLSFAATMDEMLKEAGRGGRISLFWNKIDKREKNPLYAIYEKEVISPLGLPMMKSRFPLSSRFRKTMSDEKRPFFISTIFPASASSLKDTSIDVEGFITEICSILKIKRKDDTVKQG